MSFKKSRYLAVTFCLGALSVFSVASWGQAVPAEKADEARVDRLLKQMTLEEKMDLIRGDDERLRHSVSFHRNMTRELREGRRHRQGQGRTFSICP